MHAHDQKQTNAVSADTSATAENRRASSARQLNISTRQQWHGIVMRERTVVVERVRNVLLQVVNWALVGLGCLYPEACKAREHCSQHLVICCWRCDDRSRGGCVSRTSSQNYSTPGPKPSQATQVQCNLCRHTAIILTDTTALTVRAGKRKLTELCQHGQTRIPNLHAHTQGQNMQ